jgi:hypothetical protein
MSRPFADPPCPGSLSRADPQAEIEMTQVEDEVACNILFSSLG